MEKTELIKLAVAAIFGAVAKELVSLIFSSIKNTAVVTSTFAAIKVIFSPANRKVIWDIVVLGFYVSILYNFARSETPAKNMDILIAMAAFLACIFMVIVLIVDIYKAQQAASKKDGA